VASRNGSPSAGFATNTRVRVGTRSIAPHGVHQRPHHGAVLREGAPWRACAARICTMPSSQAWAAPSTALVSTDIESARDGTQMLRVIVPWNAPECPNQSQPASAPEIVPSPYQRSA